MKGLIIQYIKFLIIVTFGFILPTGCDQLNNSQPHIAAPRSCSAEDYNQYVYDVMTHYYYWYDEADPFSQINPQDTIAYPTPQSLISVLRYAPLDRFSGVSDASTFNQYYGEGIFLGVGLRLLFDEINEDVLVAYAYEGSDADIKGIKRGDRLVEINGRIANGLNGADWTTAWGASEVGNQVELLVEHSDKTRELITVTKSLVTIKTTQDSTIFDSGSKKVGYLHFTSFLNNISVEALDGEFANFKASNVTELIVDLRYNGGGSVATASHLASLIGGEKTSGNVFTRMIYNNKSDGYDGYSQVYLFKALSNALSLNRIIFITTGASCSASELVINSLIPNPNIEVVMVGSTTCGKPVGSNPQQHCNKALSVINFEVLNSANQAHYFNGINSAFPGLTAFCNADDDISTPLGNSAEASIAVALSYVEKNACDISTIKPGKKLKLLNPSKGQSNLIIEDLYKNY